jgi:hypothetical protein
LLPKEVFWIPLYRQLPEPLHRATDALETRTNGSVSALKLKVLFKAMAPQTAETRQLSQPRRTVYPMSLAEFASLNSSRDASKSWRSPMSRQVIGVLAPRPNRD